MFFESSGFCSGFGVFFVFFGVFYLSFFSGFGGQETKTSVKTKATNEFPSFPNIASVGFATNPHNLSLYVSSTQLEMLLAL